MVLKTIPIGVGLPIVDGVKFINDAIEAAERSENKSDNAVSTANTAKDSTEQTRVELDQAILSGDSSPLAGQLSVGSDAVTYPSAQERFLQEYQGVSSQLAETLQEISDLETNKTDKTYTDNQLSTKRDKLASLMLDDLHTEVKEAMTGGSIAVVGEKSVGNENLKSGAVDYFNLSQKVSDMFYYRNNGLVPAINGAAAPVDQTRANRDPFVEEGNIYSLSVYAATIGDGEFILFSQNPNGTFNVEGTIPVTIESTGLQEMYSGKNFAETTVRKGWFIGFHSLTAQLTYTSAPITHFVFTGKPTGDNVSNSLTDTTLSLSWSTSKSVMDNKRDKTELIKTDDIKLKSITKYQLSESLNTDVLEGFDKASGASVNLFDKNNDTSGGYWDYQGNWVVSSSIISGKVDVEIGKSYTKSLDDPVTQIAYFDSASNFVIGYNLASDEKTFTVPTEYPQIAYVMVVAQKTYLDTWMVVEGLSYPSEYISFQKAKYTTNENIEVNANKYQDRTIDYWHFSDELMQMLMKNNVNGISGVTSNASTPLSIATYAGGQNQPMHPKVLYFENGLFGHKYWMGYTPYPYNNADEENPCIAFSDDGITWDSTGISNPLDRPTLAEEGSNYYNDTHLVYREDTGVLECWYRKAIYQAVDTFNAKTEVIYRQTSTDGLTWGNKEVLYFEESDVANTVSPTAIYDGSKYQIWVANRYDSQGEIRYFESTDGTNWTFEHYLDMGTSAQTERIWHMDIIKTDLGYELIGNNITSPGTEEYLQFYSRSENNTKYHKPIKILRRQSGSWDNSTLHRASLVKVGNDYKMYYSGKSTSDVWGIGLVSVAGENISQIHKLMWN